MNKEELIIELTKTELEFFQLELKRKRIVEKLERLEEEEKKND